MPTDGPPPVAAVSSLTLALVITTAWQALHCTAPHCTALHLLPCTALTALHCTDTYPHAAMARNTATGRHTLLYCNSRRASPSLSRPPCLVTSPQAARLRCTGRYRPPCPRCTMQCITLHCSDCTAVTALPCTALHCTHCPELHRHSPHASLHSCHLNTRSHFIILDYIEPCTLHRLSKMARYYPCSTSLSSSAARTTTHFSCHM